MFCSHDKKQFPVSQARTARDCEARQAWKGATVANPPERCGYLTNWFKVINVLSSTGQKVETQDF